jgi:hypothetical protein
MSNEAGWNFVKPRHRGGRRALGLYTYEQTGLETPFSLLVVIVVGAVFCLCGLAALVSTILARSKEAREFGGASQ